MADISDVTAYLSSAVTAAVYPNGSSQPSIAPVLPGFRNPMDVRIFEGWPIPEQLDLDLAGKVMSGTPPSPAPRTNGPLANVSIFPMAGATAIPYQVLDETFTLAAPTYGMAVSISGTTITVTGAPGVGEFLTIVGDGKNIASATGASVAAILQSLATQLAAAYPGVSYTSGTITVPVVVTLVARLGAPGTLAKVRHRQKQAIMVTIWAPTPQSRSVIAAAVDVALKANLVAALVDTTQFLLTYNRCNQLDDTQNVALYRRDLIYEAEYATIEKFQGITITSVTNEVAPLDATNQNFPANTTIT